MTRLLVLGMLDIKPMSGYDIQQMLRLSDAERWGGVLIGSIYHALKKLEEEGYIRILNIEHTGHRQKATYEITEAGQGHLKELIRDSLGELSVQYPSTLYSGLSCYSMLPKGEAAKALQKQQEKLKQEYAGIQRGWEEKNKALSNMIPPMVQLIFDHMFASIRLQQELVEKAMQLLNE